MEITVLEARGLLYQHFLKSKTFTFSDNFKELDLEFDPKEEDKIKAAVSAALSVFKNNGLVHVAELSENLDSEKIWILDKDLDLLPQNVEVSALTANAIASVVNDYCKKTNNKQNVVDKMTINDQDIRNLLLIFAELKDKK